MESVKPLIKRNDLSRLQDVIFDEVATLIIDRVHTDTWEKVGARTSRNRLLVWREVKKVL